ncbi:DUF2750 domain-containing protein [Desulfosediminicola flagellatus]|uniref:DUF2750 domain-containing protein n=1 Tax=Desulfosediminicola flagellatus TaxID=2569541 RepID=UPI0010AD1F5C|nr:DUF2750 domain-containing protein [Desulfosediminicola flagellatus]
MALIHVEEQAMKSLPAESFYREVSATLHLWSISTDEGVPTFSNHDGATCLHVWSSREKVEKIIESESCFQQFRPLQIPWSHFESYWMAELLPEDVVFAVNWIGKKHKIWEEPASELTNHVNTLIHQRVSQK